MEKELEKKIGQMLLIGFRGLELNDNSAISDDIINERIGGLILFDIDLELGGSARNIESPQQLKKLIGQIKSYSKTPLFLSIDQEGGLVNRLKEEYGFPQTVSQMMLGDLNKEDKTRYWASIAVNCLSEMGFNLNFAPVVDLEINPENPVIGKKERSFSSDPEIVAKHAEIIIEEHKKKNIICCIKHFPGHGSSLEDSHLGMVDVSKLWNEIELIPYKKLISRKQVDMIMTAHIFNKNLDEKYPATLSKRILTGMLRESLAFNKVIITDDLAMKAISQNFGLEKSIELTINAGSDILLFANNSTYNQNIAKKVISIIKELVKAGKISEDRVEESYNRIMELKKKTL